MDDEILDEPIVDQPPNVSSFIRTVAIARLVLIPILSAIIILDFNSFSHSISKLFSDFRNMDADDLLPLGYSILLGQLIYFFQQLGVEWAMQLKCYKKRFMRVFGLLGGILLIYMLYLLIFPPPERYIRFIPISVCIGLLMLVLLVLIQDFLYVNYNWKKKAT